MGEEHGRADVFVAQKFLDGRALDNCFVQMVVADLATFGMPIGAGRGKDPLPRPLMRGVMVFLASEKGSSTQPAPWAKSRWCCCDPGQREFCGRCALKPVLKAPPREVLVRYGCVTQ